MNNRLVQFILRVNEEDIYSEAIDIQYHFFTNCDSKLDFLHDPLFRSFLDKGYHWVGAIDFDPEWADLIGFTSSECKRK